MSRCLEDIRPLEALLIYSILRDFPHQSTRRKMYHDI
jgi:hypothetical protein